ncbi:hypothetical protein SAMN05192588_2006 [Nonlabens sp. Hel1_33_55]|uniref:hypothetical protein n=1 Tax=Nonlabens sp. Hel1_33_55 TaxID=1336802 RepID=UPI000875AEC7|nr:hypothetical protein [Nonlabens sp. Hel1_33_55]SCY27686.1 hypothetical protein SAMN05192588_2006 [Nonlabens sp. Hel1_33_55]
MRNFLQLKISILLILLTTASCVTQRQVPKIPRNATILKGFKVIADLDLEITETSGLETYKGQLITHNDSDAKPIIYIMGTDGNITAQTEFKNMNNVDWEDIAKSETDLFIADIGNNYGDRTDLKLYKIPLDQIYNSQVRPDLIELEYGAQKSFKRQNQKHSFDGEAIVYAKDRLLLFSKDWSNFNTDVYELALTNEKQKLLSIQNIGINGLVTGATFNGKNRIVLCGYNSALQPFAAVLKLNNNGDIALVERITLPIDNGAQIEAITYFETVNNQEVYYLSSEAVNLRLGEDEAKTNGQLYKMTLKIE